MGPELSVVIPLLDEALNVEALCRELTETLDAWGRSFEVVLVDDGSTDDTFQCLARLQAGDSRLRVVRLRRNFGQTAAFSAGFARARGRLIVTADGDLQNDLRDIPRMVEKLEEGYDIVCGWRKDRKDAWLSRRLPSMIANALISRATGVRLHDYGCSLKVFRSDVVKSLRLYGEMHRFIPAIASEQGVRVAEVVVNHRPRTHGTSKYGISRTVRVILDLATVKFLLSYSTRPLHIFGLIGLMMGTAGTLVTGWLVYVRLFEGQSIDNRPLLLFGILLLFTGLQLVTLGLLAEMQARTYHESQGKPTYYIRELLDAYDRQTLSEPGTQAAEGSLPRRGTDAPAPVPVARV
jgi:glycosyltransferase involved in cell wall biosynthesis